jgi:hypothetical protein
VLNLEEILCGILLPACISGFIVAIGAWQRWAWSMPLAVGVGFIIAYAVMARPRWNTADGPDWLFWLAIPLTGIAVLAAASRPRFEWVRGALAGVVAVVLVKPLSASVPAETMWVVAGVTAVAGVALVWVVGEAGRRLGATWALAALAVTLGGAGVVIFSSNFRTFGVYGLAAAAAVARVSMGVFRSPSASRGLALLVVPLLAGLMVAGRFYPEPGVSWVNFGVLLGSPLLVVVGLVVPAKKWWLPGLVGVVAVGITVAAVAAPTALKAKRAAETLDPLDAAYR